MSMFTYLMSYVNIEKYNFISAMRYVNIVY